MQGVAKSQRRQEAVNLAEAWRSHRS